MALYSFIWDDFCSWYLEMVKPPFEQPIDRVTREATVDIFSEMMVALHPFMPFVTEEIWHTLRERKAGNDCCRQTYPKKGRVEKALLTKIETAKDVISKVRELRNNHQIKPREPLAVTIQDSESARALYAENGLKDLVIKLAGLSQFELSEAVPESARSFVSATEKYFVVIHQTVDVAAEKEKISKELEHQRGFVRSIEGKLSNERFVGSAPAAVVDAERKKLADGLARIGILEESLAGLV